MQGFRDAAGRYHGGEVTPEGPPVGKSQAEGQIEEAGKTIWEIMQVYKSKIEDEIKEDLAGDEVILQWIARWAAMAYNRYQKGQDGKTAFQREARRSCRSCAVPFAKEVMYKELEAPTDKTNPMGDK